MNIIPHANSLRPIIYPTGKIQYHQFLLKLKLRNLIKRLHKDNRNNIEVRFALGYQMFDNYQVDYDTIKVRTPLNHTNLNSFMLDIVFYLEDRGYKVVAVDREIDKAIMVSW